MAGWAPFTWRTGQTKNSGSASRSSSSGWKSSAISPIRRFRQERQILARLEHANVARLIDGGTTESGMPYLVMEFVEGEILTKYCDIHGLAVTERCELF